MFAAPLIEPASTAAMDCCMDIVYATNTANRLKAQIFAALTRLMLTHVSTMTTAQTRLQQERDRLIFCFKMESVMPIRSKTST